MTVEPPLKRRLPFGGVKRVVRPSVSGPKGSRCGGGVRLPSANGERRAKPPRREVVGYLRANMIAPNPDRDRELTAG